MCHLQREWARQFGDKDKVVGWPSRLFESFLIVVSCLLLTGCGNPLRPLGIFWQEQAVVTGRTSLLPLIACPCT